MPDDSAILRELRENWTYASSYWKEIYDEGETDVRYEIEGPWDPDELTARAGRVTLALDEFGQYLNQICNEFRQNKRSVKVNPRGDGADDQTAQIRASIIREVEYQSRAQQAYVTAGEDMVRRSFGFFKLMTDYEPGSFRRVLKVLRVKNPHVIYLDPDAKEQDWSDGRWGFEIEKMREREFLRRFGDKVQVTDFDTLSDEQRKGWISSSDGGRNIQVASYWRMDTKKRPLYLLENGREVGDGQGVQIVKIEKQSVDVGDGRQFKATKAAIIDGSPYRVIDEREDNDPSVTQYMSNGIEIMESIPSDFKEIPIIPMFGREVWVKSPGGVSKRHFLSAIRLARPAYKGYCYVRSAAVERASQDVNTPYEGWEGQFATNTPWDKLKQARPPYVEFAHTKDENGNRVADKPTRNLTEPQLQQHEILAESLRRSIQAAMGGSPLPTSAQRQNQKSGIALERIENSNDQGNFHFIDNYNIALERAGRMMDAALDIVYDTPRELGARSESGEYSVIPINQVHPETGEKVGFHTGKGDHGVTISTGPSSQSMRDAADQFLDNLSQNQMVFPRIADLVVKLKNLGPIGDEIAKRLAPPEASGVPPEIAGQIQQAQQTIGHLQQEIVALKQGDAVKKYVCDEQEKTKRVLGLVKVDQQDAETLLEKMLGVLSDHTQRFHELSQQLADQQHQREMAEADRQHQAGMADAQHMNSMEAQTQAQEAAVDDAKPAQ
jgi:hypothetical protein